MTEKLHRVAAMVRNKNRIDSKHFTGKKESQIKRA